MKHQHSLYFSYTLSLTASQTREVLPRIFLGVSTQAILERTVPLKKSHLRHSLHGKALQRHE